MCKFNFLKKIFGPRMAVSISYVPGGIDFDEEGRDISDEVPNNPNWVVYGDYYFADGSYLLDTYVTQKNLIRAVIDHGPLIVGNGYTRNRNINAMGSVIWNARDFLSEPLVLELD